ncbi:MAG: helix-turn-helix transcriptional regulator [Clostridia bacterium]|nr:helix-turn-helix transcriptional regulator [Clostridia bacterium]
MNKVGKIVVKLEEYLEKNEISKNKLSHVAEMERTQINKYCRNQVTRIDTDVLARICYALNCSIGDILEYVPAEDDNKKGLSTKS